MRGYVAICVLLLACEPLPLKQDDWKVWNSQQLVDISNLEGTRQQLGGMDPRFLTATVVGGVPFRTGRYEAQEQTVTADGPAMLPAFAEGQTAAYFVTEAWRNSERPVVQPVYVLVSAYDPADPPSKRLVANGEPVPNIFGVGAYSSFGSPFWRAQFAVPKEGSNIGRDTVKNTRKVLDIAAKVYPGPVVGCPILPGQVAFVDARGFRPLSFEPVHLFEQVPSPTAGVRQAYADQQLVDYVDFGPGISQLDDEGHVVSTRIYFFVTGSAAPRTFLELPAVLAADARSNALADRVDVLLDESFEVFVPNGAQWTSVRNGLKGVKVFDHNNSTPEAADPRLALKVAKRDKALASTVSCFANGPPPGPCTWLDSEAAVLANTNGLQRLSSLVRMSVWTMVFNGVAVPP